ncbi:MULTISPECIES: hypothetical protein [Micromonospora]|uniref:Butirosin biosynthesis protein H, N-terminal n=1 Tax=Micromonospora gifhornensis TaxID=84594 RepID=A0ABQ4IBL1_9ACTN|nr:MULTISPECIES: hypothetical protein [Micromonospora]GIJ15201.1 hypothetical protein Vgi01_18850 [Micromonospora gifhornensis]
MPVQFSGETHGCYSDSLQMALGDEGPGEAVIEVLTGSAFGMYLHHDGRPFFAPGGWNPEKGIANVLDLLGWTCERIVGSPDEVLRALEKVDDQHRAMAGPVEMGLLPHHPGLGQPIGVDHYLVVVGFDGENVVIHDPRAHPYTVLPVQKLLDAWRTKTLSYTVPDFNLRTAFRRVREVDTAEALRRLLPIAADLVAPDASAEAAEGAAKVLDGGLSTPLFFHLADFMVCAGARRRNDAAVMFGRHGYTRVAEVLDQQARLIGSMEYPLVAGDYAVAAKTMRELAPTFIALETELRAAVRA